MTKNRAIWFLLGLFLFNASASFGQKVKYKDIFGLLSTKQYEQAEPFLKRYLKTNTDNPNAYLFMGIIFHEKALKMDVLKETQGAIMYSDSAVLNYEQAYKTIDDREVRKNDEYYVAYNRRDLRSGEFGVKLSDIQFDIEKRIQFLKDRNDKLKMSKFFFVQTDSLYRRSNRLYRQLQSKYPNENKMYLRSDAQTVKDLSTLSIRFDSCVKAFDNYKTGISYLGKTGYNQTMTLKDITEFASQGSSLPDMYIDALDFWNYKNFAENSKSVIEKEIIPMRKHLIAYDIEINKLRERLNTDSVSVRNDLTKLIDVLLYEKLKKFDSQPLPMQLFALKTADLEYRSRVLEHRPTRDSADLHYRIAQHTTEMRSLQKLDSLSKLLADEDIESRAKDYADFVSETYSNVIVLNSYIKALYDFAEREKRKHLQEMEILSGALKWIVDGTDSIPVADSLISLNYKPLFTEKEKYTTGLSVKDSLNTQGYFYLITPSRKPQLKVIFPVDKAAFKKASADQAKAITFSDPSAQFFYVLIYSPTQVKAQYPVTVAKIYRADGLAWSYDYKLNFIPAGIQLKPDTAELVVSDTTGALITIDKNGKLLAK